MMPMALLEDHRLLAYLLYATLPPIGEAKGKARPPCSLGLPELTYWAPYGTSSRLRLASSAWLFGGLQLGLSCPAFLLICLKTE